jgi:hypothetical protein
MEMCSGENKGAATRADSNNVNRTTVAYDRFRGFIVAVSAESSVGNTAVSDELAEYLSRSVFRPQTTCLLAGRRAKVGWAMISIS